MDFIRQSHNISTPVSKGTVEFAVDGDIIVPDVLPDILKVIQVDSNAALSEKRVNDGKLVVDGHLDLKILYIPDDDASRIKSIITSFSFSHTLTGTAMEENTFADLSVDVSKVEFQLTNSRKLKIKSVISLMYNIFDSDELKIATDTELENSLELSRGNACLCNFVDFKDTQFLVRESLEIPAGQSSIKDILKVDASVYDTEVKVIAGRVIVKGICGVCVLYTDTEECIRYCDFEIPFTEIIELENVQETNLCDVEYCVKEIMYHPETDSDGDMRIVFTEIIVGVKINAFDKAEIEYVEDCFCPGKHMDFTRDVRKMEKVISQSTVNINIREMLESDKNAPAISGIYSLFAKPVVDSVKCEKGRACVEGRVICYCLYVCQEGEMPVYSTRHELRFCENVESDGCDTDCFCNVKADVLHKNYAINSAGETEVKLSVSLDVMVLKAFDMPVLSEFEVCDLEQNEKKGIVIYFVQNNDSLWNVAKKYAVSGEEIAKLNNLEDGNLCEGMKLLIPSV